MKTTALFGILFLAMTGTSMAEPVRIETDLKFVQIAAKDKFARDQIANLGVSIEAVRSDSVWGFADAGALQDLRLSGLQILGTHDFTTGRGGHEGILDFPTNDARFHNYSETLDALTALQAANRDISKLFTIGKSLEGRDLLALNINTSPQSLRSGQSGKPGVVFMGAHHAREHLSTEIPIMLAEYLLKNRANSQIANLLATRDIWIIPIVNPDGKEYDVSDNRYRMWRKNRRKNADGTMGVDLNRNYGFKWGTGGSSQNGSSETYMGKAPFSEPETQVIKAFVEAKPNFTALLSFHTYSELVLYPWGNTHESIGNARDLAVFEKMAKTMAGWNRYTPQQSSDLYIASGDTTDWAYGDQGIFAFTFELSPKGQFGGGFYPGARVIDKVFADNLRPCLYMIDVADDPYKVLKKSPSRWLKNYVEPAIPHELMWETHPLPILPIGNES